eukprot:536415-Prorocentrum_minimum.AAC.7
MSQASSEEVKKVYRKAFTAAYREACREVQGEGAPPHHLSQAAAAAAKHEASLPGMPGFPYQLYPQANPSPREAAEKAATRAGEKAGEEERLRTAAAASRSADQYAAGWTSAEYAAMASGYAADVERDRVSRAAARSNPSTSGGRGGLVESKESSEYDFMPYEPPGAHPGAGPHHHPAGCPDPAKLAGAGAGHPPGGHPHLTAGTLAHPTASHPGPSAHQAGPQELPHPSPHPFGPSALWRMCTQSGPGREAGPGGSPGYQEWVQAIERERGSSSAK